MLDSIERNSTDLPIRAQAGIQVIEIREVLLELSKAWCVLH